MLLFALSALAASISLASLPPTELTLTPGESVAADKEIAVLGPFRLVSVSNGIRTYEAPSPIRTRALFFFSPPDNMKLKRGASAFSYGDELNDWDRAGTWQASADAIQVRLKPDAPAPKPGEFILEYPRAVSREQALHRQSSSLSDEAFFHQGFQVGDRTREGIYLPAPGTVSWEVTLPTGAFFHADAGIIPPEIQGVLSDGAEVELSIQADNKQDVVERIRLKPGAYQEWRVDLSRWGGKTVQLRLATMDKYVVGDYVQLGAPIIYVPKPDPQRVILVFVDTLRRDHLQAYGYSRDNAPLLQERLQQATIFEDARSVAPWTLPSSRSILSGRQPEGWSQAETLPKRLGAAGWVTGAFVGNVYLSTNFNMSGGWSEHGCVNWPLAEVSTYRAMDFLKRHEDMDVFLMVHYMDMHLPYKEPYAYRHLFWGEDPDFIGGYFLRATVLNVPGGKRKELKKYLEARYDQNLRYIDDQLDGLLRLAGQQAQVVFFADHGEEFFDHGDLEHGHSLYDELIRIPLAFWGPGVQAGRVSEPVSQLDIAPTILELLGFASGTTDGVSLMPYLKGERPSLGERPRAFGRPLYGEESWGSVVGSSKYMTRKGKEWIFDLASDPKEENNLKDADPVPGRKALAAGMGQEVVLAWRLTPVRGGGIVEVEVHVPGGVKLAWVGEDPLLKSEASLKQPSPETVIIRFDGTKGQQREVYIVPAGEIETLSPEVSVKVQSGSEVLLKAIPLTGEGELLAEIKAGGKTVQVTYAITPVPSGDALEAMDPELRAALEAMGYIARDE